MDARRGERRRENGLIAICPPEKERGKMDGDDKDDEEEDENEAFQDFGNIELDDDQDRKVNCTHLLIACSFCGKSISSFVKSSKSSDLKRVAKTNYEQHQPHGRISVSAVANKVRVQSCPSCRKPLPRCSLCLTHLGTPSGIFWQNTEIDGFTDNDSKRKLSPFNNWFTWCQSCRHGGHGGHMKDWFKEHEECPISGCSCKCMTLDEEL